ncbi:MAG: pantoate--beta-alanine ligase [Pseudomonadota bacterium]
MTIITDITSMQKKSDSLRLAAKRIVFVPTMGFFHEGHLSLMSLGKKLGDHQVVSIFVNPAQFGPHEDFWRYPRAFERDRMMAESAGVDTLFCPEAISMYAPGHETYAYLEHLPRHLCGLLRPNHFQGVATVIVKLFNIVKPHTAVFGEKDYQQLAVIRKMSRDLNFGIDIVSGHIVRESDGLAMSSRNLYLSGEERCSAIVLSEALAAAQNDVERGEKNARPLISRAKDIILSRPHTRVDYISLCDPETLEDVDEVGRKTLMALAVYVGKTRLIDNAILG